MWNARETVTLCFEAKRLTLFLFIANLAKRIFNYHIISLLRVMLS